MASNLTVSPFDAFGAARSADQWNKHNSLMPPNVASPKGTGSFGRFVHEIGYLTDLFTDQCTVEPWVLAIASIPAILDAWAAIESPDPKHIYHEIAGESLICSLKSEIRAQARIGNSIWDGAKKTIFKIAEFADLAVWRLYIASVLADGLIDWQTLAQEISGCKGSVSPFSSSQAQGAIPDGKFAFEANGLEWLTNDPHRPAFGADVEVHPGETGQILWALKAQDGTRHEVPVLHWVENSLGDQVTEKIQSLPNGDDSWHSTIRHFRASNTGSDVISYYVRAICPVNVVNDQAYFLSGFCSTRTILKT